MSSQYAEVFTLESFGVCYSLFPSTVGPTLNELAAAHKWEVTGDMCFIRNQEELIKPKKILAKIELDSKWYHTHPFLFPSLFLLILLLFNILPINPACLVVSTGVSGILATIAAR